MHGSHKRWLSTHTGAVCCLIVYRICGIRITDAMFALFAAEEYRVQHAGQQQQPDDEYYKVVPFHSVL